jgi:hypothetical protein
MGRPLMIVKGLDAAAVVAGHLLDCEQDRLLDFHCGIHSVVAPAMQ